MIIQSKIGTIGTIGLAVIVAGVFVAPANALMVLSSTDTVLDAPILSGANLPDPTATTGNVRID